MTDNYSPATPLGAIWGWLDGKKTFLGYIPTQFIGNDNVLKSLKDAGAAWLQAFGDKNFVQVIEPTCNALAQVLLLVGVTHKAVKAVKASDAVPSPSLYQDDSRTRPS